MAVSSPPSAPNRGLISADLADNRGIVIPVAWRVGQFVLMGLVALLAIWYAVQGFKSPAGDSGRADNFSPFDLVGFVMAMALISGRRRPPGSLPRRRFTRRFGAAGLQRCGVLPS